MSEQPWPPFGHLVIEQLLDTAVTLHLDHHAGRATFIAWTLIGQQWRTARTDDEVEITITRESWWDLVTKIRGGVPRELFESIRARYGAVVHERDRLLARVDALEGEARQHEAIAEYTFTCELHERAGAIGACQRTLTVLALSQGIAVSAAIRKGWICDGDKHHCAICAARVGAP